MTEASPTDEAATTPGKTAAAEFESTLPQGPKRFLSQVVDHSVAIGRRSAKDFIRHFPPAAIMAGLEPRPDLRANILGPTTGTHPKIAVKKSAASAGEDLQIALDEGLCNEEQVLALFQPDDRVRYLPAPALWAFVVEGEFWSESADELSRAAAPGVIAFMLDCARENELITDEDIIDGCTLEVIVQQLPKDELCMLLSAALLDGRAGDPFRDEQFLEVTPPHLLLEYLPLDHIWDTLIVPRIAAAHGLLQTKSDQQPEQDDDAETTTPPPADDDEAEQEVEQTPQPAASERGDSDAQATDARPAEGRASDVGRPPPPQARGSAPRAVAAPPPPLPARRAAQKARVKPAAIDNVDDIDKGIDRLFEASDGS